MHIFPNDKKYIGIARQDRLKKRWGSNGCGYFNNRQPAIERAIKKYGWGNINHIILEKNLSKEKSKKKEIEYIRKYNTFGENGYNLTPGGDDNTRHLGGNNPSAKAIIFKGIRYETLKGFCDEYGLKASSVSGWLHGYSRMPLEYYEGNLHYEGSDMSLISPQVGKATGLRNKSSQQVVFKDIEYPSVKAFCEKFGVDRNSVYAWVSGKIPMPAFFYNNGLHYKNQDIGKIRCSTRKDKYVYTDSA